MAAHSVFLPENSMDRGACWAPVHGVTKSWTRLKQLRTDRWNNTYTYMIGNVSHVMYNCVCVCGGYIIHNKATAANKL